MIHLMQRLQLSFVLIPVARFNGVLQLKRDSLERFSSDFLTAGGAEISNSRFRLRLLPSMPSKQHFTAATTEAHFIHQVLHQMNSSTVDGAKVLYNQRTGHAGWIKATTLVPHDKRQSSP